MCLNISLCAMKRECEMGLWFKELFKSETVDARRREEMSTSSFFVIPTPDYAKDGGQSANQFSVHTRSDLLLRVRVSGPWLLPCWAKCSQHAIKQLLVAHITCAQMGVCWSQYGTVRFCVRLVVSQQYRLIRHATHPMLPFGPSTQLEFFFVLPVGFCNFPMEDFVVAVDDA